MMHPDTEVQFISEEIGYGVVAKKFIPRGTITWVQDELDQIYTPQQVEKMKDFSKQMIDKYTFRNNQGNFVLCWDISKYVNHSFKSNCFSTAYDFEIAVRDIQPGEELTDDYGYLNVTDAFKAKDEGTSRTTVYPDDLLNYHEEWDRILQETIAFLPQVDQPLMSLVSNKIQQEIKMVLNGEKQMESILSVYYQEETKIQQSN
ncbi:SET domain-containing protein [Antarcticibacterium flavum]|uniref:SET domain-containing protein n=1 Tax=Antarcticibacterium flavum TaxID=2058175 RepID=A0A5B7X533_9FLAO|nr:MULTISPECIES: SET domain-containing protein [Antarcticibacterium]MCM4160524.1 SET domain-containing protein-lysine N-methyltransferase [Antarcticibacterium sp. W02-3]QCY69812.1 SET domain-containing protein [Antarcticibacterium flavum]